MVAFISYNLGLSIPQLAIEKDQFGMILFTNVSSFDVHEAYAPLCSFTRNSATVVFCTPKMRPVVVDGVVQAKKIAYMMFTVDHRYQDGSGCTKIIKAIKDVWGNPKAYL